LAVFYNTSSSEIGNRFIPTDTTDPATGWTSDHCQNGFAVKQTGDAHPKAFLKQDGLYVGDGTVAPSIRFRYRLAGSASVNAHWVADSNATYDLGGSGVAWRDLVLTRQIFINGVKILGTQGAAVADATGAGDVVAQLNALLARCRAHGIIAT
jgi:glycine cleavage system aminomethyltransferase T